MTDPRHHRRGQSIVLMSLTAMFLAFTLMTTFSIGKAIHEKVALQQAADAAAYSLSVEEARAFNYYAYANRSMVSHDVALMATFGHISYSLAWKDVLAKATAMLCVSIPLENNTEATAICAASGGSACAAAKACLLALQAPTLFAACQQLQAEGLLVDSTLGPFMLQQQLITANEVGQNNGLAGAEQRMDYAINGMLQSPSVLTDPIVKAFDHNFTSQPLSVFNLFGMSQGQGKGRAVGYCSAVDGPMCHGGTVTSAQAAAANNGRYAPSALGLQPGGDWLRNRQYGTFEARLNQILVTSGVTQTQFKLAGAGMSRMINSTLGDPTNDLHSPTGEGSSRVAAEDHVSIMVVNASCLAAGITSVAADTVQTYAASGQWPLPGTISTLLSGFLKTISEPALGFGELTVPSATSRSINFIPPTLNPAFSLFNQPRTFALVTETFTKDTWGPFGIKLDSAIKLVDKDAQSYDNVVTRSDVCGRQQMAAMAQGLTYYHRPGDWVEPPNFYNPFWRAKLQPFDNQDEKIELAVTALGSCSGVESSASVGVGK